MSATLQAETFVQYFGDVTETLAEAGIQSPRGAVEGAKGGRGGRGVRGGQRGRGIQHAGGPTIPVIRVEGRTFPVQEYYLEDALHWTGFEMDSATMRLMHSGAEPLRFDAIMHKKKDPLAQRTMAMGMVALTQALPALQQRLGAAYTLHHIHDIATLESRGEPQLTITGRLVHSDDSQTTVLWPGLIIPTPSDYSLPS